MIRRAIGICLVLACLPVLLFAGTTGKITGKVLDRDSGEPLPGANISIAGTVLGASSDEDGTFVILNVPVGAHELHARYMGYKETIQQDIRVSVDLTTEVNFALESTTLTGETVVITAERPIIRKDETNTNIIRSSEEIDRLPIRGVQELSASIAGVAKLDNSNNMNIRGGRTDESAVYVDGVLVNDPYNYAIRAYVPNEAIEELSVQTGGFNAEYGEAMSGIIIMTTNSGTQRYSGSLQAITDQFLSYDKKNLGTYSYGFNEYTATLGGPIIPGKKHTFFFSGTRQWMKDGAPSWGWAENKNKPDAFKGGPVPGQEDESWSYSGKLKFQLLNNLELKSSAVWTDRSFSYTGDFTGMNPLFIYNVDHAPKTYTQHRSVNATLTHLLKPTTYYDLKFNYFYTFRERGDRMYMDDFTGYGNPYMIPDTSWAKEVNWGNEYTGRYEPDFFKPGAPNSDYFKNQTLYWGVDFDLTHQQGKYHTFKLGFDYKYHTLREMQILEPYNLSKKTNVTELTRYRNADVRFYGYDLQGKEVNEGSYFEDVVRAEDGTPVSGFQRQAPYHPILMSGYIQDKIELRDLILNLGLRYDRIDPNAWQFRNIAVEKDADGNNIPGTGMFGGDSQFDVTDTEKSEAYDYLSPRFGISFPVSDRTVFHAQYGKFYQKPSLMDLYLSPFYLDNFVKGGYFTTIDNPNLRPEKTTGYEVGFKQLLSDVAAVQLTAFYKETEDLIQVLPVETDVRQIAFTQNGDFGVIKGFDVIFTLRRIHNLSATINYEYQHATGTGSATNSNFDIAWLNASRGNYPKFTLPLNFQQKHRGNINLDYRMEKGGPELFGWKPFENTGVNLMASFNSGIPYTLMRIQNRQPHTGRYDNDGISKSPVSAVNSVTTPWNYRVDLKLDKTFPVAGTSFSLNMYLWVLNLFNSETITQVWSATGLPDQTGYLQTEPGKAYYESLTEEQKKAFSMREMDWINYGNPRQIRLGMRLSF
ncbi:TonB-dependent receptor [bacterium]|nr:TonB-dependent receptor [bacterium]